MSIDSFFDRIADFIKSIENKLDRSQSVSDPDLDDAWNELNDYLNNGRTRNKNGPKETFGHKNNADNRYSQYHGEREFLSQDYANLEVSIGAPFDQVKRSYKNLLRKYHPDKHAGNTEQLKIATQITQKINVSFQKISSFEQSLKSKKMY